MKWLVVLIATLGCFSALEAQAAAQSSAPYSTGKLCWTWVKGAPPLDANADHLNVKCGTSSGARDIPVKTIALPATPSNPPEYCINIKDVLPQPTTFPVNRYCASTAAFGAQESKESVEFPFSVTGPEIAVPTNPKLVP